jgi:hypothetical protein
MDDVREVRPRQRICGVRIIGHTCDAEIGHVILPPFNGLSPPYGYAFVTETQPVGNSTNDGYSNFFNT